MNIILINFNKLFIYLCEDIRRNLKIIFDVIDIIDIIDNL